MISCPKCGAIEVKTNEKKTWLLDEKGKRVVKRIINTFCKCTICRWTWWQ